MKLTKKLETEILDVYEAYWGGLLNVDMETYAVVLDKEFKLLGTTEAEVFFKKMEAVRFLKDTADQVAGNIELRNRKIKVEPVDKIILITEQNDTYVNIDNVWSFYAKTRISTILQKKDNTWKLVQMHLSHPDMKAAEGQTIGLEKISKENIELREAVKRRTIELENKSRELQIEAALERVRARTMAMQKSEELPEAATILFQQVQALGMPAWSAGYCIWNDDKSSVTLWMSSEGVLQQAFTAPTTKDELFIQMRKGQEDGKTFHVVEMGGKKLVKHYQYMRTLPVVGDILDSIINAGHPLPTFQIMHHAYFSKGFLLFITYEPVPDAHDIFKRFGKVFDQTYTRFLDLQKAEAQALRAEQDLMAIKEAKQKAEEALTELQATQKQLIQSEKMASLGELTAGIAHEIQNPLNFVNNFSEVSKELLDEMKEAIEKGDTEEAKEIMNDVIQNLEKINHHGKRADGIVKGMLQHSRSSSNQKEATDINALADEYLRLAYHGLRAKDKSFNATTKTEFDESIGNINIIPQDIGRVILNLITNAFLCRMNEKASNRGTPFQKVPPLYEPTVSVSTKKDGDKVEIKVNDNGNGIPQKILDKIFQPFFTTKPTGQGTGLGLSLSYDIVKAHGGELKVETKENEGTEFTIQLPV